MGHPDGEAAHGRGLQQALVHPHALVHGGPATQGLLELQPRLRGPSGPGPRAGRPAAPRGRRRLARRLRGGAGRRLGPVDAAPARRGRLRAAGVHGDLQDPLRGAPAPFRGTRSDLGGAARPAGALRRRHGQPPARAGALRGHAGHGDPACAPPLYHLPPRLRVRAALPSAHRAAGTSPTGAGPEAGSPGDAAGTQASRAEGRRSHCGAWRRRGGGHPRRAAASGGERQGPLGGERDPARPPRARGRPGPPAAPVRPALRRQGALGPARGAGRPGPPLRVRGAEAAPRAGDRRHRQHGEGGGVRAGGGLSRAPPRRARPRSPSAPLRRARQPRRGPRAHRPHGPAHAERPGRGGRGGRLRPRRHRGAAVRPGAGAAARPPPRRLLRLHRSPARTHPSLGPAPSLARGHRGSGRPGPRHPGAEHRLGQRPRRRPRAAPPRRGPGPRGPGRAAGG